MAIALGTRRFVERHLDGCERALAWGADLLCIVGADRVNVYVPAANATVPSTIVSNGRAAMISAGVAFMRSAENTEMSARLPTLSVPKSRSRKTAWAGLEVNIVSASRRLTASSGCQSGPAFPLRSRRWTAA